MLPTLWEHFGEGLFRIHDFASVHKASSIESWLGEFDVEELDWPDEVERRDCVSLSSNISL